MPHLTSDALRQDPEGLAFLRSVLERPEPRERKPAPVVEQPVGPPETVILEPSPAAAGPLPSLRRAADAA